jgi:hypothetical protein
MERKQPNGRLIGPTYKTYEGARKRAAFENGVAPSEFKNGYKVKLYAYTVEPQEGGGFRVRRTVGRLTSSGFLELAGED